MHPVLVLRCVANIPRRIRVELAVELLPCGIGAASPIPVTTTRKERLIRSGLLEECDQLLREFRGHLVVFVLPVETVDLHNGQAALVRIARVGGDFIVPPAASTRPSARRRCGRSACRRCRTSAPKCGRFARRHEAHAATRGAQEGIAIRITLSRQIHHEVLQEDAIDAVIAHPLEVPQHRAAPCPSWVLRLRAVGICEPRHGKMLVPAQLAHVRPHFEGERLRRDLAAAAVVNPTHVCRVACTAEPGLIAAHHLAANGARIDGGRMFRARAAERAKPRTRAKKIAVSVFMGGVVLQRSPKCPVQLRRRDGRGI